MTKSSKAKLAYMAEYQKRPENERKQVERHAARRQAMREGLVHKGDGKDVDHIRMLDQGGSNDPSNRRVVSAHSNRGWRKKTPGVYGK